MNPLVSMKCAGRVLMALAAISGIFLTVGCGSSNGTKPNQNGFTKTNLNGTYVFTSNGADSGGGPLTVAGAFTANGSSITGGTMDIVDAAAGVPSPAALTINSGSYTVGTDGRGNVTLTSSFGTITLYFVLTTTSGGVSSHGLVTEFDTNGTGVGTLDLQTVPTSLTGNYAFTLGGGDSNFGSFASVGAFTLNASNVITQGVEDFNDSSTPALNEPLSGTATLGSGTAPGSISMSTTSFALTFDFYPIDSTHWKMIETDGNEFLAGDAFSQTSTSIPSETLAFTMGGGVASVIANAGTITSDGSNNFTGTYDVNNNGTVVPGVTFTGPNGTTGSVGGRTIVNLTGFDPASQLALYPSSVGLLMLETDSNNVTTGIGFVQSGGAPAASQGYGFNLAAFNTGGGFQESDNAQFTTNTSGGFSGIVDTNDDSGGGESLSPNQPLSGSYTTSGNSGSATTMIGNNSFVSFNFYAVDSSTFLVLETDSNQIGVGSFELQNSPTAALAAAHPHIASITHPRSFTRAAWKHKR